jgi:hypothetical protein
LKLRRLRPTLVLRHSRPAIEAYAETPGLICLCGNREPQALADLERRRPTKSVFLENKHFLAKGPSWP